MQFINMRELRIRPGQIREALTQGQEVVLTRSGRPFAIIAGITEDNFEEVLRAIRQARAQLAIARMRQQAMARGLREMPSEEIEATIAEVRESRR